MSGKTTVTNSYQASKSFLVGKSEWNVSKAVKIMPHDAHHPSEVRQLWLPPCIYLQGGWTRESPPWHRFWKNCGGGGGLKKSRFWNVFSPPPPHQNYNLGGEKKWSQIHCSPPSESRTPSSQGVLKKPASCQTGVMMFWGYTAAHAANFNCTCVARCAQ